MYYKDDMRARRVSLKDDQSGMVAFVVTSFIIIMMSLLVLAFSQNTRREQRQALDRQLSTQAYYTAESAINETIKYIKDTPASESEKDDCAPVGGGVLEGQDTARVFTYTCVMWDKDPEQLVFQNLDDQGKTTSIQANGDLRNIRITWEDVSGGTVSASCNSPSLHTFPQSGSYSCGLGMIRVAILPFTGDRASLVNATYTGFLRPQNNATPVTTTFSRHDAGSGGQGNVIGASCTGTTCTATINNLPLGKNFLFIKTAYKKSNVTIEGVLTSGAVAQFTEGQIEIDATARASDVIKRIKVAVPKISYNNPGYSADVMDGICKDLEVWPTGSGGSCHN